MTDVLAYLGDDTPVGLLTSIFYIEILLESQVINLSTKIYKMPVILHDLAKPFFFHFLFLAHFMYMCLLTRDCTTHLEKGHIFWTQFHTQDT